MSVVSRPFPALPAAVCPVPVKTGARWLRGSYGHSRQGARVSCTGSTDRGFAAELEEAEYHERTYGDSVAAEDGGKEEALPLGWSKDEMEAISALFDRPMRQKPLKPPNPVTLRPLPLPLAHKTRLPVAPAPKQHIRLASRSSYSDRVRKNPEVLVGIAREISALRPESDVAIVLDRWAPFLRKGSLSMTIRELGHMGLPERALQTLCWAQKQTAVPLFPNDRILASTVEVLARFDELRMESALEDCVPTASRVVLEAMASGFIRAGKVGLARKVLELAKINKRTLHPSIYAKLILEAARTPEGYGLAAALLDELGERPDFDLRPQDCTAVMKVCIKLRRYTAVESLFSWFRESGRNPTVVMYTTVIHSRSRDGRHRDALALVWEMEQANCLLDLPAYRVVVKLCVELHDPERAFRYLSRLKDDGFVPTSDMYCNLIEGYPAAGRMAKCRQLIREAESTGVMLDKRLVSSLSEMGGGHP